MPVRRRPPYPLLPALLALALAAAVVAVYLPAAGFGFFVLDDSIFTYENPTVAEGVRGFAHAFTRRTELHWIPLTALSHQIEVSAAGMSPQLFHRTNIALHAAAMGTLLLVLWRALGSPWPAAAAAALLALHPLRVESVVWITGRKDVLSMLFAALALACWVGWLRSRRARWYVAAACTYAAALMAKPTLVPFPLLLAALDYWPFGRAPRSGSTAARLRAFGRLLLEKTPFFALAAADALVTFLAQSGSRNPVPWPARLERVLVSPLLYLRDTAWPAGLSLRFSFVVPRAHPGTIALALAAVAALTALVFACRKRWPFLGAGWLWYLLALLPVSGVVPTGAQWLSDRFTYLPHVGLALAAAGALLLVPRGRAARTAASAVLLAALLVLAALSRSQAALWGDDIGFLRRAVALSPKDAGVFNVLGTALCRKGRLAEAVPVYQEAIRLFPSQRDAHFNLGLALAGLGRREEARAEFSVVLMIDPGDAEARVNLARLGAASPAGR